MAGEDGIVIDSARQSATFTAEGLDADTVYQVNLTYTDETRHAAGEARYQSQMSLQGYGTDANGSLSVSVALGLVAHDGANVWDYQHDHATLHMWVHPLPASPVDADGNLDPAYNRHFTAVLVRPDGNKAEATATIN